jgi:hypothetical protein
VFGFFCVLLMAIAIFEIWYMISFSELGKKGRLGNQLFQIASTMGIAAANNVSVAFPKWKYATVFETPLPYWDGKLNQHFFEKEFTYSPVTVAKKTDTDIHGWLQSEKYFEHIADDVKLQFRFKMEFLKEVNNKLPIDLADKNVCAIHVRRGDYVNNPNYAKLSMNYYIGAMKFMPRNLQYLIFSDDITWCKKFFGNRFHYAENTTAIEDLAAMSMCHYHIISNSSFSWWGAWLGEVEGKSVTVAPHMWNAGELLKQSPDTDIVPKRWIRYNPLANDADKIDLRDVTFTIPIRIDHAERLENLNTCIDFLHKYFDTNIIVCECDVDSKISNRPGINYTFKKSKLFHRTQLLNAMAKQANTPIIFNWDADVFISPSQIEECVNQLRNKQTAACYPYDGRFLRVQRHHLPEFKKCLTVEYFKGMQFSKSDMNTISFGGAIAWNKELFFELGGENENFIDYGPEDFERFYRATKLGHAPKRVKGALFHINHNINSQQHAHLESNHKEYKRIQSLSKQQLLEEVQGWNR